ncbi:MAG: hypothetical protein M0R80_03760 [Proteobacteria bacterium]|jgi:hypothetical protein|nr:hypothetical protein [Pseudomonadota bacterium]
MSSKDLENEIEALKAGFCEEIIETKHLKAELEFTKSIITALVVRLGEKVFVSDSELFLLKECEFSTYRHAEKQGIIIETRFSNE